MVGRWILAFDVETTGLLPKQQKYMPAPTIAEYPHILQLSFALYDLFERRLIRTFDSYVRIPYSVPISPFVQNLTGISRETCDGGRDIILVLDQFYEAYVRCSALVGHNLEFDEKMILVEMERNRAEILRRAPYLMTLFNTMYESVNGIERYCTMKRGVYICNLDMPFRATCGMPSKDAATSGMPERATYGMPSKDAATSGMPTKSGPENETVITEVAVQPAPRKSMQKKWPKLVELYSTLFVNEVLENAHNSMVDVLGCLRCYLKMRHHLDLPPFAMP
jgi:hypothetical protein